jgi:hypothetical protein
MQPTAQNQSVGAFDLGRRDGFETQAGHQRTEIRVAPTDFADTPRHQPMLCFDGTKTTSDSLRGFDDLDLVTGLLQSGTANQPSQSATYNDDRCHFVSCSDSSAVSD